MKFSTIIPLALAAFALAKDIPSDEVAIEGDVYMSAADLDREEGLILSERGIPGVNILPVSTKCAAAPRTDVEGCNPAGTVAHLTHPTKRTFIHDIIYQRCANTCTCRPKTNGDCMSFAWRENPNEGVGRGLCILYGSTLSEMGISTSPRGPTDFPERNFYSRSCFHKSVPSPVVMTGTVSTPTPVPRRKRGDLRSDLVAALEHI